MSKARDLANAGTALTTVSPTELGYLDGVTSAVQTQIDSKQAVVSGVNDTEIGYLDGVTSAIQTQINSKIGQSTAINPSTITTKGDLIVGTGAGTFVRQGVGTNGQVLTADSAQADGVTWATPASGAVGLTLKRSNIDNVNWRDIATNGSNIWVIVGALGNLSSSTDGGTTWTARTSGFGTSDINVVTYGLGIFVAGGNDGKISTSTDGITWTARTANVGTEFIISITLANDVFFAGAAYNSSRLSTSTDGITWTSRTLPATPVYGVKGVAFGNGYYVAVGQNEGGGGIMYSTNLSSWTNVNITINFSNVVFANNRFIAYNASGTSDGRHTGNNPTTGWTNFATENMSDSLSHNTMDFYNGSLYHYNRGTTAGTPFRIIGRQKTEINTTSNRITEIYQNYFSTLPLEIQGLTSKGDGTFGMVTSQGIVYFAS